MSPNPSRVPVPGDITPDALTALRATLSDPQSREARYYAAAHRDTVLRVAQAAMALADEEMAERAARVVRLAADLVIAEHDRVIAEHDRDRLRTRMAEVSRRVGLLAETIESECDTVDGLCHEHDLTDDGRCALLADVEAIGAVIRGESR